MKQQRTSPSLNPAFNKMIYTVSRQKLANFAAQKSKLHFLIEPSRHPRAGAALSALAD
jgi:hypothetical protein